MRNSVERIKKLLVTNPPGWSIRNKECFIYDFLVINAYVCFCTCNNYAEFFFAREEVWNNRYYISYDRYIYMKNLLWVYIHLKQFNYLYYFPSRMNWIWGKTSKKDRFFFLSQQKYMLYTQNINMFNAVQSTMLEKIWYQSYSWRYKKRENTPRKLENTKNLLDF